MDRNDKDLFPPVLPAALGVAALALAVVFLLAGRNGRAFAMTGLATISLVATLFVSLYPRVHGVEPRLREQPHGRRRRLVALRADRDDRRGRDLRPIVLLYQGWTYYVFRRRVGGEREELVG